MGLLTFLPKAQTEGRKRSTNSAVSSRTFRISCKNGLSQLPKIVDNDGADGVRGGVGRAVGITSDGGGFGRGRADKG